MGKIQELPKSSSRLLTCTQIITSVYCVVKELIENALDSGAKNVEVKLEEFGLDRIEVKDSGCGIDKNDIAFVAKSHFTSKISSYSDLDKILTYGFRGEALGAICAVADLVITTKSSEESIGSVSNFDHDGQVISTKPCPCVQGTTVSVLNLFKNIPVRKQFYRSEKNKKDELRKVEDLLISYSCIQHDVRFALYHNRNLIWQKSAVSSPKDALIQVLGNSIMDHMKFIDFFDEQTQRKIELYLPKLDAPPSCGFNNSSKCLIAVNKRPVILKAVDKLLKEYYNRSIQNSGKARYPICFISFTVPLMEVDVNVEPNKTSVMLHHSEEILTQFSELLKSFYSCDTVTENNLNVNNMPDKNSSPSKQELSNPSDFLTSLKNNCESKLTQQSKLSFVTDCVKIASNRQADNSVQKNDIKRTNDNSLQKKDITRINDLNEPCKKKPKTSFKSSSNDINTHIATLNDFFVNEGQTNSNQLKNVSDSLLSVPRITVQRNSSVESELNLSELNKDLSKDDDIYSNRIKSFAVSTNLCDKSSDNTLFSVQDRNISDTSMQFQRDFDCSDKNNFGINKSLSSVNDIFSNNITNCTVNTNISAKSTDNSCPPVQDRCISDISLQFQKDIDDSDKNNFGINKSLSSVNNISTFAVSTNICARNIDNLSLPVQDKNISDTSLQFQGDIDGSDKNNFGINKSLSSIKDTLSNRIILPVSTNLNADKDHPSVSAEKNMPVSSVKCNESAMKNLTISNDDQNSDLWSRGVHPSGETIQPVAILQPKTITTPKSNQRQTNNAENCNKKSPSDRKSLSFERKLTAFDIFCRSNRLEVAAQNPEFNNHQIAQILSEKWSRLSPEEKAVYKNMLNKDYRKDIKNKERLSRTISQNLSQDKKEIPISKKPKKKKFRLKTRDKPLKCSIEEIRSSFLNKSSCKQPVEDLNIINYLAPGIWICTKAEKLVLLNTFRLQETIIYHRLLETFQFDIETLETPVYIPASHLGDDAMATLISQENNNDGSLSKYLIANGFNIRLIKDDNNETAVELLGITKLIAFYGILDLEEILLHIKEKGYSAKLSECRPGKVILYLQSEANRMCRRSPACQRIQDVKDLLLQKESLLPDCSVCIHHKPFFHEIWHLARNEACIE